MPESRTAVPASGTRPSRSMPGPSAGSKHWHAWPLEQVLADLGSDPQVGLAAAEVERRQQRFGLNSLVGEESKGWPQVLARQFTNVLILILLVASALSFSVGEVVDAITILAIILLNGMLGFVQEWKAEKALAALKQMLSPRCTVLREGCQQEIEAENLVPGDVVLLAIGDRVPADLRLIEAVNLKADESALTGESGSVVKEATPVADDTPLALQRPMVWMGTNITNGRAQGVVVATGMATAFGRIAELTLSVGEETTPLQRKLAVLGKQLGGLALAVSLLVVALGWILGKPLRDMVFVGVSLAVAVVPEGLPAVVTITLALGIRAMSRRRALLRRLQAAETLGAATVICTDKTGTLTKNEMTVQRIWLPAGSLRVSGTGYEPVGSFASDEGVIEAQQRGDLMSALEAALVCNHARITSDERGWRAVGEPTEAALVALAAKAGLHRPEHSKPVTEFSFNSSRKRMTVIEERPDGRFASVKGAPEVVVERCSRVLDGAQERALEVGDREAVVAAFTALAESGLRTLALARRALPAGIPLEEDEVEQQLTLLALVGIIDPPREQASEAIRLAESAGIRVLMVTGDAAATALAIAQRIGLQVSATLSGSDLTEMDDPQVREALGRDTLFARTTPEHKLRLVRLLQESGHVVGMTGDGVNDAPALKQADIGIAMGLRGTDVAKGAADIVLTDDNFASIVGAIEEGRRQYDNIQKFVRYLLSSNIGELLAVLLNILLGGPLLLLPVQILWMNLVTDGFTAVALGLEPAEQVMRRPPRRTSQPILDRAGMLWILLLGGYIGLATLFLFHYYFATGRSLAVAHTVAFTGIVILEKMNVFNFRSLHRPLATLGVASNPWLLVAWVGTLSLQVCAVYVPFLQNALHTVALGWGDWTMMFVVAAPILLVTEAIKWFHAASVRSQTGGIRRSTR